MPHTSTAKKRLRQNKKLRLYNRNVKKQIKVQIKLLMETVTIGTPEQIKDELSKTEKRLDNAAAKNVIHRNLAARKKSQLARMVNGKLANPGDHKAAS